MMRKILVSLVACIIAVAMICAPTAFADPIISPTEPGPFTDIPDTDTPLSETPDDFTKTTDTPIADTTPADVPSTDTPPVTETVTDLLDEPIETISDPYVPLGDMLSTTPSDYVTSPQTGADDLNVTEVLIMIALVSAFGGISILLTARKITELSR